MTEDPQKQPKRPPFSFKYQPPPSLDKIEYEYFTDD